MWCQKNNLSLNVDKTKELIVDSAEGARPLIHIDGNRSGADGKFQVTRRTHHRRSEMIHPHRQCGEDGATTPLQPQETGGKLSALQDTYTTRCHRKAKEIIKDNNHPSHCLLTPLPSRRRGQNRCIKAGTERLKTASISRPSDC